LSDFVGESSEFAGAISLIIQIHIYLYIT
jgi:hypothetical protein